MVIAMRVQEYIVNFQLPACRSLKEKRQRLQGLRDRFGKLSNVALGESDFQDVLEKAQWTFIIIGLEQRLIEQTWSIIETYLREEVDAYIVGIELQRL